MTVGVTIPDPKSADWFERLCAKRGWFTVDGAAWVKHADAHAQWFGDKTVRSEAAPKRRAMTDAQRACLRGDV